MTDESQDKLGEAFDLSEWTDIDVDVPQQNNSSDCGVFVCKFIEYVSQDREFNFTCADMPRFRREIAVELIRKHKEELQKALT